MSLDPLVLNSILLASMEQGKLVARAKSALPLQSCRPTQPVRWEYREDGDGSGPSVVSGPPAWPTRDGASGVEPSQGSRRLVLSNPQMSMKRVEERRWGEGDYSGRGEGVAGEGEPLPPL